MTEGSIERMLRTAEEKKRESDAMDPTHVKDHPFVKKAVSTAVDIPVVQTETGEAFGAHVADIMANDPDKSQHQQLLMNEDQPPQAA